MSSSGIVASRSIRVVEVETSEASPFARSLLFGYVGAFVYEGDVPLAEKKAAALSLDATLLAELLGKDGLKSLLDADVIARTEADVRPGGERAFYTPNLDYIRMPDMEAFVYPEAFYATLAHELGHHARGAAPVGGEHRVVLRQPGQQVAHEGGTGRDGEPHVGALAHALQQPGVAQQLEVP